MIKGELVYHCIVLHRVLFWSVLSNDRLKDYFDGAEFEIEDDIRFVIINT